VTVARCTRLLYGELRSAPSRAAKSVSYREMAMANRRGILVSIVFFSIAVSAVRARSQTHSSNPTAGSGSQKSSTVGANIADDLTVRWSSVTYRKGVHNPAVPPEYRNSMEPDVLAVSCVIQMADPRLLLGVAPDPTIEKIADSQGNDVELNQQMPATGRRYEQGVFFIRWLKDINLSHLERTRIPSERYPPRVELDAELPERIGGEIGLLRGRYEALVAESIEYVDLPFRPDDNWVRLTPDVEIRVVQARNVPDVYHYEIEQRPAIVPAVTRVDVSEQLPNRVVVGRQMIIRSDSMIGAGGSGPGRIGGRGDGIGRAEGIRFVIAVNPAPVTIPFELRHVPLSAPAHATPPHTLSPRRLEPKFGGRFVPSGARIAMRYEADKARSQTKPVPLAKEGQFFDVDWRSIDYTLNLYNPTVSRLKNSLNLSVRCEAEILDPELVLGTCGEPIIERITDAGGRNVDIVLDDPRPDRMCYETPRYRASPTRTGPSALVKLEGKARSALKLPLRYRHRPKHQTVLEPVRMTIRLDPRLIGRGQKEIGLVEGYFHALTAKSYKHVKVPFKPGSRWVRLTSDREIRVARAWHDGVKYRYEINERSKAQIDPGRLHVYCPLPDGILVERRFTGPDVPEKREGKPRGARSLPARAGGNGLFRHTVDGADRRIDTIDYRIAVGPTHYKIPIKLEHIPLP